MYLNQWQHNIKDFILIIGAMKCGTSSLFHNLAEHPQVCYCMPKKEPNFFASDADWSKGVDWYLKNWQFDLSKHKVALEASTDYTKVPVFPNAASRIENLQKSFNGLRFKFIYIMRDPIERIESHIAHERLEGWKHASKNVRFGLHQHLIDISSYYKQISEYYKRFNREEILLLNFNLF
jgi:hypothetical protein